MLRRIKRLGAALALSVGGATGTVLVASTAFAPAAHAVEACVSTAPGVSTTECTSSPAGGFAVNVEVAATDEAPCDEGAGPVSVLTGSDTGVEACAAGAASLSAEESNLTSVTSPGGEVEACVVVAGCSGFESDGASGGEG